MFGPLATTIAVEAGLREHSKGEHTTPGKGNPLLLLPGLLRHHHWQSARWTRGLRALRCLGMKTSDQNPGASHEAARRYCSKNRGELPQALRESAWRRIQRPVVLFGNGLAWSLSLHVTRLSKIVCRFCCSTLPCLRERTTGFCTDRTMQTQHTHCMPHTARHQVAPSTASSPALCARPCCDIVLPSEQSVPRRGG